MTSSMLSKVRGLLDTAESLEASGNAKAAASYRAKAEALRDKYRLEEEDLIAKEPTSLLPVLEDVLVCSRRSPFFQNYVDLYATVARHAGVRVHFDYRSAPGGGWEILGRTVGYETDIRFAEVIFTNARLVFADRLEPKVKAELGDQVNAYRLRAAGMERVRVAEALWGNRDKANLAKVGRLYKAECVVRGEPALLSGRGVTGAVYREQYAEEFVIALRTRLRVARDGAGQYGGGLVLHGRQDRVNEAFFDHFPNYRPRPSIEQATEEQCERCQAAKKRKGDENATCRDHKPWKPTKADMARYDRQFSVAATRGREAGGTAAKFVDLGRTGRGAVEGS